MILVLIFVLYFLCGLIGYAACVADFYRPFGEAHYGLAFFVFLAGPVGLLAAFAATWSLHGKPFRNGFMLVGRSK